MQDNDCKFGLISFYYALSYFMIHVLSSFIYYTDNISLLILAGKPPFVRAYTFLSSCVFMIMVSISRRSLMEQPSDYKSYCFALDVNVF